MREVGTRQGQGHGVREGGAEESEEGKGEGREVEGEGLESGFGSWKRGEVD